MVKTIGFLGLWLGFGLYAFFLAPPDSPDTVDLIRRLSTGDWEGINPAIAALFNLMGIWPMVYACVALIDGHQQRLPAWPFVLGSFGLGAFVMLPYLALRQPQPTFTGPKTRLLKLVDARWLGWLLFLASVGLIGYGLVAGDWQAFIEQWQTSRFIHVMSLDFCLLWLVFPALLRDDMARRDWTGAGRFWPIALVPLLGAAIYLALRPPLPDLEASTTQAAIAP